MKNMSRNLFAAVIFLLVMSSSRSQNLTPEQYVEQYKDLAIREMKRMGVPAAITLAQGLLETENGNSALLKKSNNHFGIKCKNTWSGNGVSHDDDAVGECFRTYKTAEDSYRDHSNFLRGSERYAPLFQLDPADYKAWAHGLKKAGYATNPQYPAILIRSIEKYNLQQYTLLAVADVPKYDKSQFEDDKEVPFVYTEEENTPAGSDKIGYINKVKCVMATKGTSLLAIATRQDIDLVKLLQYNDLEKDGILNKDQPVFIEKKALEGGEAFYVSKAGESLLDVAQQNGIQLEYLAAYNGMTKQTVIREGTKLYLKPGKSVSQKDVAVAEVKSTLPHSATAKFHEVKAKEGLYGIAKKYGVTVQEIKEWNNLSSDNLSIGQQLKVSK